MPARPVSLSALVLTALFGLAASAQTPVLLAQNTAPAVGTTPSLTAYTGHYTSDGGLVQVDATADGLVLTAHGATVAARLAGLATSDDRLDAHAADLLDAWVAGDLRPLVASVAPERTEAADADFATYRTALVRGHGEAVAGNVIATFRQVDGRRATLAQILFEHGTEFVSFVWADDGALSTLTRGLSPVVLGEVRPIGPDAFEGAGTVLRFERADDGRIASVSVGDRLVAAR
ncbi:MAG: hypothetical protein AAF845_17935 [Bacteroidota bacterium]